MSSSAITSEQLLPDSERVMPLTRPDSDAAEHKLMCYCEICKRPDAMYWKKGAKDARKRMS